jgi:hypothetical protein
LLKMPARPFRPRLREWLFSSLKLHRVVVATMSPTTERRRRFIFGPQIGTLAAHDALKRRNHGRGYGLLWTCSTPETVLLQLPAQKGAAQQGVENAMRKTIRLAIVAAVLVMPAAAFAQSNMQPDQPNSGAGIPGQPGGKSGPAAKSSGSDTSGQSTTNQDVSKVPGLPGNKSGPPAKSKD